MPGPGLRDVVMRKTVASEHGEEEVLLVRDVAGLIALVQSGVLEIHPWGATIDDMERPDRITFDFDPGDGMPWSSVLDGARELRERLDADGARKLPQNHRRQGSARGRPADAERRMGRGEDLCP